MINLNLGIGLVGLTKLVLDVVSSLIVLGVEPVLFNELLDFVSDFIRVNSGFLILDRGGRFFTFNTECWVEFVQDNLDGLLNDKVGLSDRRLVIFAGLLLVTASLSDVADNFTALFGDVDKD